MGLISLTNSSEKTIVDDEMVDYLSQWNWKLQQGYVARHVGNNRKGTGRYIFMHRVINETPDDKITDHINRNKLDNRKENLRTADSLINQRNRLMNKNNISGINGVWYNPKHGSAGAWIATKVINNKQINKKFGCFKLGYNKAKHLAIEWRNAHDLQFNILNGKEI